MSGGGGATIVQYQYLYVDSFHFKAHNFNYISLSNQRVHALVQAIAGDISAHKPVYEGMCVKCQELLEHGVEDAEELQQKLDNAQQRWNAIQVRMCVVLPSHV